MRRRSDANKRAKRVRLHPVDRVVRHLSLAVRQKRADCARKLDHHQIYRIPCHGMTPYYEDKASLHSGGSVDSLAASRLPQWIPAGEGYRNACEPRRPPGSAKHHWRYSASPGIRRIRTIDTPWDDRAYDEEMRLAYRMSATTPTIVAEESFVPASRPVLRSGGFSVIPDPRISQIEFHCVYTGTEDNEGWGLVLQRGCGSGCRLP